MRIDILLAVLFIAIFFLFPRRRNFESHCERLIRKLPPTEYEELCGFADPTLGPEATEGFRMASKGLPGVLSRIGRTVVLLQIIHAHYFDGRISRDDAAYVLKKAAIQGWFSLIAIPEAAICHFLPNLPPIAARTSVAFYCDVVARTNVLCLTEHAPEYMQELNRLL